MLPIHDSFIVRLSDYPDLVRAMESAMLKTVGIKIPIKITEPQTSDLTARLSKHWQQFDSYDPSQDNPPEPELTNQFVPGFEGYQRRDGRIVMERRRSVFGSWQTQPHKKRQNPAVLYAPQHRERASPTHGAGGATSLMPGRL